MGGSVAFGLRTVHHSLFAFERSAMWHLLLSISSAIPAAVLHLPCLQKEMEKEVISCSAHLSRHVMCTA
jgi:hypothetical protein